MNPICMNAKVAICHPDHTWTEKILVGLEVDYPWPDETQTGDMPTLLAAINKLAEGPGVPIIAVGLIECYPWDGRDEHAQTHSLEQ